MSSLFWEKKEVDTENVGGTLIITIVNNKAYESMPSKGQRC